MPTPPHQKKIILIGGPTASGKSLFALRYASQYNGEIVNTDSMQLYRGLEILSSQPSKEDFAKIPHHLYGVFSPLEACDAAKWLALATKTIRDILERDKTPILVGGTGLYFMVLEKGLSSIPTIDEHIKQEAREFVKKDQSIAYEKLTELDPSHGLHPNDTQRITRALEVVIGTGHPIKWWQSRPDPAPLADTSYESHLLLPEKIMLQEAIQKRAHYMLEKGAIEEVEEFRQKWQPSPEKVGIQKTIGFFEICAYLKGEITKAAMLEQIILKTRQYAKRQITWFRGQFEPNYIWERGISESDWVQKT